MVSYVSNLGLEHNFDKVSEEQSHTQGTPYDYNSVMHYGRNAFTNGNGSTIITKDPKFQDVIGQRLEVSPNDILKLNRLYSCSEYYQLPQLLFANSKRKKENKSGIPLNMKKWLFLF